jgi:hypothetical protein
MLQEDRTSLVAVVAVAAVAAVEEIAVQSLVILDLVVVVVVVGQATLEVQAVEEQCNFDTLIPLKRRLQQMVLHR